MHESLRGFLIIELLVCFSPACLILLLGIIMSPMQIYFMFTLSMPVGAYLGTLAVVLSTIFGLFGLVGLYNVVVKLYSPNAKVINRKYALAFTLIALLPLLPIAVVGDTFYWRLMAIAPIVATFHIMYLARGYLFGLNSRLINGNS